MLSKDKRLNLKKSYKWVSAAGQKIETPLFRIFYRDGSNENPLVGIATSKAFFKKAHERNLAKRLTSEALQKVYPRMKKNINVVIMPKDKILERRVDEIYRELENVKVFN